MAAAVESKKVGARDIMKVNSRVDTVSYTHLTLPTTPYV